MAASSQSQPSSQAAARGTKSRSTTEEAQGFHRFEIRNYSLVKALSTWNSARSGTFPVGGYDWSVVFYPSGCIYAPKGHTSVYLQLMTGGATARATFAVRLVNPASGRSRLIRHSGTIGLYDTKVGTTAADSKEGVFPMTTAALEAAYVDRDRDRLTIECTVTVIAEPHTPGTAPLGIPEPPSSSLPAHLGRLLQSRELADVTFDVRGERFAAHKLVLAMRSPVFKAELFGPLRHDGDCITIQDVPPAVFKILLGVIYTDAFPAMDDADEGTNRELARHLLAAADRYGMDRLKAQCGNILATSLNAQTVASTLALADRHGCHQLKDACVEFIIALGINDGSLVLPTSTEEEEDELEEDRQPTCFTTFLEYFCIPVRGILRSLRTKFSRCGQLIF